MRMFCIALLALSGFTVNAASTCSDLEIEKACRNPEPAEKIKYPETEEQVDAVCKYMLPTLDCLIRESEKCPDTFNGKFIEDFRERKESMTLLCTKGSEYHNKFIKSGKCLGGITEKTEKMCEYLAHFEYSTCGGYFFHQGCMQSQAYEKCGQDGYDVWHVIFNSREMKKKCLKDSNIELRFFPSFSAPLSF